jgi:integrase
MTIKVREWTKGKRMGFEVDIRFTYPDGTPYRQRIKAPVESKSAAKRWGEARERELLVRPSPVFLEQEKEQRREVPTLLEFGPRFIEGYARANRQKASTVHAKERILANHLYPALGDKKLDAIDDEAIQSIKSRLASRAPKTVNNVLTVLGKLLRVAVRWKVLAAIPCTIDLLRVRNLVPVFFEFGEYERLVGAASKIGLRSVVIVLLGGDAGLRSSEMVALRWTDVDFERRHITVEQAAWRSIVDAPKSGRGRIIPMTRALSSALRQYRHLRGERVLYTDEGRMPRDLTVRHWFLAVQHRAGVKKTEGGVHVLRHTFCSHLAMRGAPARAIQELAGHEHLTTTQRYMHLSPAARNGAIDLLNDRSGRHIFGEMLETDRRSSDFFGGS